MLFDLRDIFRGCARKTTVFYQFGAWRAECRDMNGHYAAHSGGHRWTSDIDCHLSGSGAGGTGHGADCGEGEGGGTDESADGRRLRFVDPHPSAMRLRKDGAPGC